MRMHARIYKYQGNDLDLEAAAGTSSKRASTETQEHSTEDYSDSASDKESEGGGGNMGTHNTPNMEDAGEKKQSTQTKPGSSRRHSKGMEEKDDWEWLLTSSTKTYACTGIFRSACWLLSEVGKPLLELMNQGYRLIICGHSLGT